jgi:hypothetical protein
MVKILPVRINSQYLAPVKTTCLSYNPYNYVCIPSFEHQEIGGQSCEKISFLPSFLFFFSQPVFSYFLRRALATTNHTLVFPIPPGTPPAIVYLRPGKVSPPSPHVPPSSWLALHDFACNGQMINMVVGSGQRPCEPGPNL